MVEPGVKELDHLALGEGRGKGVALATELTPQNGLVDAAGAGALGIEIGEGRRHGEGLESQQHVHVRGLGDLAEDGRIAAQGLHVNDKGGRLGQCVHNQAPNIQMRINAPSANEKRRHDRRTSASCPSSRASRVPPAAM